MLNKAFISILSIALIFTALPPISVEAQEFSISQFPAPGSMVAPAADFVPLTLKGLVIHPEDAFKFDFLMDTGNSHLKGKLLKDGALKLMKYFLTALTIPEDDMWVNLSPYEKGRIVENNFGSTLMGRDLLAEDYVLKQLTASLIYPENVLGKKFWSEVYTKAARELGTTQIPVNTFNKVWIVPSEAVVWEHGGKVIIVKSHLKVMLEEDYLALEKNRRRPTQEQPAHALASQAVRQIVLPVLEKQVNKGRHFSQLRQMYQAMILATWYKRALKESIITKVYVDRSKIKGVDDANTSDIESIYQQYLKAFKKGAFNYIKEDLDPATGQIIPRKYFSGGFSSLVNGKTRLDAALVAWKGNAAQLSPAQQEAIGEAERPVGRVILAQGLVRAPPDSAMASDYTPASRTIVVATPEITPSRYESGSITLLKFMAKGTVPIVSDTGYLSIVQPYNSYTGKGFGFKFERENTQGMFEIVEKAFGFYEDKERWQEIEKNLAAERPNLSWESSVQEYYNLYLRTSQGDNAMTNQSLLDLPMNEREQFGNDLQKTAYSFVKHRHIDGRDVVEIWAANENGQWPVGQDKWFQEQWGRDTFLSLGALWYTNHAEEASKVISEFANWEKNGLIPNRIPDSKNPKKEYNSVDAPLLFIKAIKQYVEYTDDWSFALEMLSHIRSIIANYERGTGWDKDKQVNPDPNENIYRISVDSTDGLVMGPVQATWMDALRPRDGEKYPAGAVTPRNGKANEINAFWYESLEFYRTLLEKTRGHFPSFLSDDEIDQEIARMDKLIPQVRNSYQKFLNPSKNALYDVIGDGTIPKSWLHRIIKAIEGTPLDPSFEKSFWQEDSTFKDRVRLKQRLEAEDVSANIWPGNGYHHTQEERQAVFDEMWAMVELIQGDKNGDDIRPNMIFAVPGDLLPLNWRKRVFDTVKKYLFTDEGLRTLSPEDPPGHRNPRYKPRYNTEIQPYSSQDHNFPEHKDFAYHQGTVWPWLMGPYVDALAQVMKDEGRPLSDIQKQIDVTLQKLVSEFRSKGTLPEVYDAEPREDGYRHPGGTPSQAWSVVILLEKLMKYGILPRSLKNHLADYEGHDSTQASDPGGIDFNSAKMDLHLQNDSPKIKLNVDPAMLEELQNAPGFWPEIIDIKSVNLSQLFGFDS